PSKSLFNVKKSRLFHSAIPPTRTRKMESQRRPQYQEVFRTLQLVRDENLSISEVAARFGVHKATIYRAVTNNK
ncbi:helix-turn-helix domain-containing protein, partial [Komagataeibacter oboediens]|uniref:helix-turn-helix domain-containing protein n=1 Tax=Komagataeibacter oboediens TaxID=65958 RepID=UPI0020B659DE